MHAVHFEFGIYVTSLDPRENMKNAWIVNIFCGLYLHMLDYYTLKGLVILRLLSANVKSLKIGIIAVDLTKLSCLQDGEKTYFIQ